MSFDFVYKIFCFGSVKNSSAINSLITSSHLDYSVAKFIHFPHVLTSKMLRFFFFFFVLESYLSIFDALFNLFLLLSNLLIPLKFYSYMSFEVTA